MSNSQDPLEAMERLTEALKANPHCPFSDEERAAIERVATFFRHLDALVWWWGIGKWIGLAMVLAVTQWDRIGRALAAWGQG